MEWSKSEKTVLPLTLCFIIIIVFGIYMITRNKSDKVRRLPLLIITVIILVMEIIKQTKSLPYYSAWNIPLHFCSTFMIWFSLAVFSRTSKWREIGFNISVIFGIMFLSLFYINPGTIIGNSSDNIFKSFSTFHTFSYHHLIILFVLLAFTQKQVNAKKQYILYIILLYTIYSVLAITCAHLLQVNFTNLLRSNINFMQQFNFKYGIVAYTILMYLIGLLGCFIGFLIIMFLAKFTHKDKMTFKQKKTKI